jgi:hypothetical protein
MFPHMSTVSIAVLGSKANGTTLLDAEIQIKF